MLTARVSDKIGNIRTLIILNIIWFLLCLIAYFVQYPIEFYLIAGFVGMVMGGTQALSRSTYSKLIPKTDNTCSYFSFYHFLSLFPLPLFGTLPQQNEITYILFRNSKMEKSKNKFKKMKNISRLYINLSNNKVADKDLNLFLCFLKSPL